MGEKKKKKGGEPNKIEEIGGKNLFSPHSV